jgi:hypothetical protein
MEMAKSVLVELMRHEASDCHFLFMRNESWIPSAIPSRIMQATSRPEVDQVVRPSHPQLKRMITVFFKGTRQYIYLLNILPGCEAVDRTDFLTLLKQ